MGTGIILRKVYEALIGWLLKPDSFVRNCVIFFVVICVLPAVDAAFHENRPVAAFAETFAAHVLVYLSVFGSLAAGIYVGMKSSNKSTIIGWIVGISVSFIIGFSITFTAHEIPGVGWRIEKMTTGNDY